MGKSAFKNVYFLLREQYADKIKSVATGNFVDCKYLLGQYKLQEQKLLT